MEAVEEKTLSKETHNKIASAMQICASVAKLYKKHGSPANYHPATHTKKGEEYPQAPLLNHQQKRAILNNAWRKRPAKHEALARCGTCGLFFVKVPARFRCMCPVAKPRKEEHE